jgi:hypothetical protein
MTMPRSVPDILDHAEELARRFDDYETAPGDERNAVEQTRSQGYSWAFIGKIMGTSGEAVGQRYAHKQGI